MVKKPVRRAGESNDSKRRKVKRPVARILRRLEETGFCDPKAYGDGGRGPFDFSTKAMVLSTTLQVAVPLWVAEMEKSIKQEGEDAFWDRMTLRCQENAHYLGAHGDALMFRVKGTSGEAFNRLAESLACMSFVPGGVTFLGIRWERKEIIVPTQPR